MHPDTNKYRDVQEPADRAIWVAESREVPSDYKNLAQRKGQLEPLKP